MDKNEKKTDIIKNIIIFLLIISTLLLTIFTIFSKINISGNVDKNMFLNDILETQSNISYYLGNMHSDTFGIYDNISLLTGSITEKNEEIKNNKDEVLIPIVDKNKKVENNKKVAYQIDNKNYKKVLDKDLPDYDGIKWFIQDGIKIKVKFDSKPSWWSNELDYLIVGNN